MGGAEDGGGFGHKVDAAKDDVAGFGPGGGLLGQQERVALKVGVLDDFLPLIMVAQDGDGLAQALPDGVDAVIQFGGGAAQIFGGDLLPADIDRQFLGQGLGRQLVRRLAKGGVFDFGQGYGGTAGFSSHNHLSLPERDGGCVSYPLPGCRRPFLSILRPGIRLESLALSTGPSR